MRVVERAQLDRVLGEQHLQGAGEVDTATAARVGKLTGATLIAVGAYQQSACDVRLTARFVQVETGEIVGTAKVDGRASEFLRLQDKVTAELLRSAGMQQHIKKHHRARARAAQVDAHPRALRRRRRRRRTTPRRRSCSSSPSPRTRRSPMPTSDLAALEKRMKQYEALSLKKQDEKTRALLDGFAKESDPQKQAMMAYNVLSALQQARRYRTLVGVARSLASGPAAASTMPGGARVDELALYYAVIGENVLKQRDAVLHDGEDYLRRFPTSSYFAGAKAMMDVIIREKHEEEQGKEKVKARAGVDVVGAALELVPRGEPVRVVASVSRGAAALPRLLRRRWRRRQERAADAHPGRRAARRLGGGAPRSRRAREERSRDVSNDEGRI